MCIHACPCTYCFIGNGIPHWYHTQVCWDYCRVEPTTDCLEAHGTIFLLMTGVITLLIVPLIGLRRYPNPDRFGFLGSPGTLQPTWGFEVLIIGSASVVIDHSQGPYAELLRL